MSLNVQKHGSGVQRGQTVASLFQNGLEVPELDYSGQLAGTPGLDRSCDEGRDACGTRFAMPAMFAVPA